MGIGDSREKGKERSRDMNSCLPSPSCPHLLFLATRAGTRLWSLPQFLGTRGKDQRHWAGRDNGTGGEIGSVGRRAGFGVWGEERGGGDRGGGEEEEEGEE
jgi:hypothetical protein